MNLLLDLKRNGWIWQITILSLVLGMLLAAALKTQRSIRSDSGIPTTRFTGLAKALLDEKDRNKLLETEIKELRAKVDESQQALVGGSTQSKVLGEELQQAKFLAGLIPARGSGVEVTLRDSNRKPPADVDVQIKQEYIIHDADLRNFVNELLANGAETIAINDQRIIAKTAIRCVGAVIKVNDVPMAAPFKIIAIGPPDLLESALKMPGGIMDEFRFIQGISRGMVQIRKSDNLTVPAYSGSTSFKYAIGAEPEARRQ
jgi:uncharacterized protein YlxW (UPF0749 family)